MKLLKEIYFGEKPIDTSTWDHRRSSRAVVFDRDNNIAILCVQIYEFPKLPGGGVEEGEDLKQALYRECLEEIGCKIEILDEVGEIIEYRQEINMLQNAYCFVAKIIGDKGLPQLTPREIEQSMKVKWLPINEAIKMFNCDSDKYVPKFIKQRELTFLLEVKKILNI